VSLQREVVRDARGEIRVVFDDENPRRRLAHTVVVGTAGAVGNETTKRAPPPGADSTRACPPFASATSRTMVRPMPLPPLFSAVSPRKKGRQMSSRSFFAMPGP